MIIKIGDPSASYKSYEQQYQSADGRLKCQQFCSIVCSNSRSSFHKRLQVPLFTTCYWRTEVASSPASLGPL